MSGEKADRIPFSAETSSDGSAMFMAAGTPHRVKPHTDGTIPSQILHPQFHVQWFCSVDSHIDHQGDRLPDPPVAQAAPSMPSAGTGPIPNIIMGSSIIFTTHPQIMPIMVIFIFPTD